MTFRPARSTPASRRAVSLLSRVILPRPGEPLDVRKLYIEESEHQRPPRARRRRAPRCEIGAESEVSFATYFNAFPASYWRRWSTLDVGGAARRADRHRPGRRLPLQGHRRPHPSSGAPISSHDGDDAGTPSSSRSASSPFEDGGWIWFDITTDTDGHACTAPAGTRRCPHRARRTSRSASRPSTGPTTASTRCAALTSDPLVDKVIGAVIVPDQGTRKVRDHPGLRRGRRGRWATGCRSTTSPTSAAPAATAGSCTRR